MPRQWGRKFTFSQVRVITIYIVSHHSHLLLLLGFSHSHSSKTFLCTRIYALETWHSKHRELWWPALNRMKDWLGLLNQSTWGIKNLPHTSAVELWFTSANLLSLLPSFYWMTDLLAELLRERVIYFRIGWANQGRRKGPKMLWRVEL